MIYRLAEGISIEETADGGALVASRPLRLVRLNPSLLKLVRRMAQSPLAPASEAESKVLETLAKRGFVKRQWPELGPADSLPTVSIVIPVKDRADELRDCLTSLQQLDYPQHKLEIVVVDDGSTDNTPAVAEAFGALLVESGAVGGGPALARNKGARTASGEILAFIDSDCTASAEWLKQLLPVFAEDEVAAVGGWVDGMFDDAALDCYEAVMSSLNLGRREMSGGAGGDTFYLPSCNLLVKKKVFRAVGGFNEELHVGEDVDLTWRIRDCGSRLVYRPGGVVRHDHRTNLWPFMKRRFQYGTSEAVLTKLHQWRRKRIKANPTGLLVLGLLLYAWLATSPVAAALAGALFLNDLARAWMYRPCRNFGFVQISMARLRVLGALGYHLTRYSMRYFAVILWPLAVLFPGFGALWICLVASVCLLERRSRKCSGLLLPVFMVFHILETTSYGLGVLYGCWNGMDFRTYRLTLSAKPL